MEALLLLRVSTAGILTHSFAPEDYNLQQHHSKNLRFSHCAVFDKMLDNRHP
jgi:hypothetical protein